MGRRLTKWSGGDRCHSGGFLLRIMPPSWQPVPACTRNGHSAGGQFINAATNAAGGPFFPATTIKQQAGHSSLRRRKLESDAAAWRQRLRRRAIQYCDNGLPQAEMLYFATKKIGIGRGTVATTTAQAGHSILRQRASAGGTAILCDEENLNRTRHHCGNDCAGELFYLPERWHCSDS